MGTAGAAFASAEAKVCMFTSNIDGVRERSEGAKSNQKDSADRERDREQSSEEDSDWRMEDIGVQGNERVQLVTSDINGSGR